MSSNNKDRPNPGGAPPVDTARGHQPVAVNPQPVMQGGALPGAAANYGGGNPYLNPAGHQAPFVPGQQAVNPHVPQQQGQQPGYQPQYQAPQGHPQGGHGQPPMAAQAAANPYLANSGQGAAPPAGHNPQIYAQPSPYAPQVNQAHIGSSGSPNVASPNPGQPGPAQYGPGQYGPGQYGPGQYGPGQYSPGQYGPGQHVQPQPNVGAQAPAASPAVASRRTHMISTVNAPKGSGFGAMAALSLRRAFRLRIEPNEVLADERTAMLTANPPIVDENQQAFLAWRRSVLFMAALVMLPTALFHAISSLKFEDGMPEGWKTANYIAVGVEIGFALYLWTLVPKWTAWHAQSKRLAWGWLLYFFVPFLLFLYPLASAYVGVLARQNGVDEASLPPETLTQIRGLIGATIGAQALVTLAPKVISLLQGVIRASIATKTLFPGSTAPGWTMVLAAPLYMVIFYIFVLLPYHFSGSALVVVGLLLVLSAKGSLVRAGLQLAKPMTSEQARAATSKTLALWMTLLMAGIAAIVGGLWDLVSQASAFTVLNFGFSVSANVLVLTLIATDGIISALDRARGTTEAEAKLVAEAAAQIAGFASAPQTAASATR